ncbi:hypothetical protein HDV00_009619 [Rhizophlyctis rosea]|nr:hypothetical protein HDV00_009619 [Rhizophlyctis rosea]
MHHFGGIYADLDTEAVKPFTSLLTEDAAYIGQMGEDKDFQHSLPNAWLASSRGHPFWLHVLGEIMGRVERGVREAEFVTGPVVLRQALHNYLQRVPENERQPVHVLDPGVIYPYDWHASRGVPFCWGGSPKTFNETACKDHFEAHGRPNEKAYMITYWTHAWSDNEA